MRTKVNNIFTGYRCIMVTVNEKCGLAIDTKCRYVVHMTNHDERLIRGRRNSDWRITKVYEND